MNAYVIHYTFNKLQTHTAMLNRITRRGHVLFQVSSCRPTVQRGWHVVTCGGVSQRSLKLSENSEMNECPGWTLSWLTFPFRCNSTRNERSTQSCMDDRTSDSIVLFYCTIKIGEHISNYHIIVYSSSVITDSPHIHRQIGSALNCYLLAYLFIYLFICIRPRRSITVPQQMRKTINLLK